MQPANALHDRLRNPVEHDETFLAIFNALARNDEYGCVEFRHLHLIVPLESANLLFPQPRVYLEERHACEVVGQLLEQEGLLLAAEPSLVNPSTRRRRDSRPGARRRAPCSRSWS